ncbi:MAG: DNA ligase [Chloroflexota bacterium]
MLFRRLADYFNRLEATTSRNLMVEILAELFRELGPEEVDKVIYLCQGQVVPPYQKLEFGIGEQLLAEAIALAAGRTREEVRTLYKRLGDYGRVVEEVLPEGRGDNLEIADVFNALYRLAEISGAGAVGRKTELIAELLKQMNRQEGRYLVRILVGKLRLGIGDPTLMEGLSYAVVGDKSLRKEIELAYNIRADLGQIAQILLTQGIEALRGLRVQVGVPIRPALAERVSSIEEILRRHGKTAAEPKLDGFRCQVHKDGDKVKIFSRNLEDFSEMFPEIVQGARTQVAARQAIIEGEAIAYDPATGDFLPFQVTVQRRRKYDIDRMMEEIPLKLVCFDLLYADGEEYIHKPYVERREALEKLVLPGDVYELAEILITDDPVELETFFADKVARGLEGIVCKRPDAAYHAGVRQFFWIKFKRGYKGQLEDTIDTVIVGYWYGRGHRARLGIGSLLTAVYDSERDLFVTVSRLGSGFTEEEWVNLRKMLEEVRVDHKPARVESLMQPDVWVEPVYVVTVQADEITRSPLHTCGLGLTPEGTPAGEAERRLGYALRFPRAVSFVRADKKAEEATTVAEILRMYTLQRRKPVTTGAESSE